jgi:[NiFe] hydrogenase diaphorase moiety small subunit
MNDIHLTIDGRECIARPGQTIIEAAKENGIYIPALCYYEGLKPAGACRVCTVRVSGRYMAACTQPVTPGMAVENDIPELRDMRQALIEMLFAEGNHFCPACEKSGNCELQALAYRLQVLVPRFPYQFPQRPLDASDPKLFLERNRCIQCRRCLRAVLAEDEKNVFGFLNRSQQVSLAKDPALAARLSEDQARRAMEVCPTGALLRKGVGFAVPIGRRKFDLRPIGSDIEKTNPR